MNTSINTILRTLLVKHASDLHLQVGSPPVLRINGDLSVSDLDVLTPEIVKEFVNTIMNKEQQEVFKRTNHIDLAYSLPQIARFRINIFRQRGQIGAALRVLPEKIPTLDELGAPPIMKELALKPNGLVLVTGPTGSGKTTTLAAMIEHINTNRKSHIITIEDPIEFQHQNKSCLIDQRELGADTESFAMALRDALREDPDIVLVGEMRDLETISNAITAAETGHLVLSTLHTNDVVQTIDRMIDVFPSDQQSQIRTQLAAILRGVIAQVLLRKKDGSGRIAAFETMVANTAIKNLIMVGKTNQAYSTIQTCRQEGMQLMAESLKNLCKNGIITKEEAMIKVNNPGLLEEMLSKQY